jgi:cell division protein FtsL
MASRNEIPRRPAAVPRAPRTTAAPARLGKPAPRGESPDNDGAPERWLRNIRLSGFTITMLVILILGVVVVAPSLRLLIEQQQQISQLQQAVKDQQSAVNHLKGEVARWSDPAYIEAEARDRLLYVYPGEYSYLVINDGSTSTTSDGAPISKSIQTTKVDWAKSLLGSILTAGLTDATATTLQSPVPKSTTTKGSN